MEMSLRTKRWKRAFQVSVVAGLTIWLVVTAAVLTNTKGATGAESADLAFAREMLRNCQLQQGLPNLTSGERTAANRCVSAQTKLIAKLTSSPSPSPSTSTSTAPSPSASPSVSPSASPSPSPSPSPTTPPPGQTNCWAQLTACGYPDRATTGRHLTSEFATSTSGDLHIFTAGTVIDNKFHSGAIYVHAANVTIKNSYINLTSSVPWGINTEDVPASGPTIIVDTDVVCNAGQAHGVGAITGPNFRATRVWSVNCENAMEMGVNSQVMDSYLQGSENGPDDPHGDGIQAQSGNNIIIRHNTLLQINPVTSAIITNPTFDNNWIVENNILGGGAYTLYCPEQGTNFVVRNNRFYPYRSLPSAQFPNGQRLYFDLGDNRAPAYGHTDACNHSGIIWSGNYDEYLRPVLANGSTG